MHLHRSTELARSSTCANHVLFWPMCWTELITQKISINLIRYLTMNPCRGIYKVYNCLPTENAPFLFAVFQQSNTTRAKQPPLVALIFYYCYFLKFNLSFSLNSAATELQYLLTGTGYLCTLWRERDRTDNSQDIGITWPWGLIPMHICMQFYIPIPFPFFRLYNFRFFPLPAPLMNHYFSNRQW